MKFLLVFRALLVAIVSMIFATYVNDSTIISLTVGILALGFIANIALYKFVLAPYFAEDEEASYHSAHSL